MPVGLLESKRLACGTDSFNGELPALHCHCVSLQQCLSNPVQTYVMALLSVSIKQSVAGQNWPGAKSLATSQHDGRVNCLLPPMLQRWKGWWQGQGSWRRRWKGWPRGQEECQGHDSGAEAGGWAEHLCLLSCSASAGVCGQVVQATTWFSQAKFCWWVPRSSFSSCLSTCWCMWAGTRECSKAQFR